MQSKHNFETVNWVFQNIYNITIDFGRKVLDFCKDFRQTLPIVLQGLLRQIISKFSQKISFSEQVEIFSLSINMQLQNLSLTEDAKLEI